uniref:Uncharacterized protein n=1 Tax=Avena sativa TaxID=4498 RepID=A0ACD5TX12_AVESA
MHPGGGRGGEDGCKKQGHPPATGHRGRDRDDAPSHSSPLPPSPQISSSSEKKLEDEQQKEEEEKKQPLARLPEDALVEILSRLPYRSLCRFKCVSKPWLALCSATDIRRRSRQTLSGFFHFGIRRRSPPNVTVLDLSRFTIDRLKFRNLSGRGPPMVDPSLPFLRERYSTHITVEQCSSSLLLCHCWKSSSIKKDKCDYVVCNPATEKCIVLPPMVLPDGRLIEFDPGNTFLGVDTAAPSCFVVFALREGYSDGVIGVAEVAIYSSETGRWILVQSQWGYETTLLGDPECVFLNGIMHLTTAYSILAIVDVAGKVWRKIKLPRSEPWSCYNTAASIGQSQGRLYAWQIDTQHDCQLNVWVLEDHESGKWNLKHTVNALELFGRRRRKDTQAYKMFAIHPECNLIFITDEEAMTVSYDIDNQKVHVISTSEEFLEGLLLKSSWRVLEGYSLFCGGITIRWSLRVSAA